MSDRVKNKGKAQAASPVGAELRMAEAPFQGWYRVNIFRQDFFRKALLLIGSYGFILGVTRYLYLMKAIGTQVKDFYGLFLFLIVVPGALYIRGRLTAGRFAAVAATAVAAQAWEFFFFESPKLYILYLPISSWYLVWWMVKSPETMRELGLRRDGPGGDLPVS
ncbi:hypothetical protein ACFLQK_00005, partial [bacterium]